MRSFGDRRALVMLLFGFAAGMPILLIFSSLSLWLREAGIERSTVTMFSWAALGYSFKFVWAPLIDSVPLPWLTARLGRRRAWILLAQLMIIAAIAGMALVNPADPGELTLMALAAVLLGFSSATHDIVIDAYRIEIADTDMQPMLAATYSAGYRIGMVVAGAGALYLATFFGAVEGSYNYLAWRHTYLVMAACMSVGVLTTLLVAEPAVNARLDGQPAARHARMLALFAAAVLVFVLVFWQLGRLLPSTGVLLAFVAQLLRLALALAAAGLAGLLLVRAGLVDRHSAFATWVEPVLDFFARYGQQALWLLALIGLYRISDIVAGVISNVFYQDMGFSKNEIATAVKLFGVIMTIAGGLVGGVLAQRFALKPVMLLGALLACATNLLFVLLALRGDDLTFLYLAVAVDNLAAGLASAAFIAFLSALTSVRFTAVQYAIFSSLMTLLPKVLGGYSGAMVDHIGYPAFFTVTALIGLPVLWLVQRASSRVLPAGQLSVPAE